MPATAPAVKPDVLDRLTAGIAQLTTTDAWIRWLRVQSRFHRYSFNNVLLIAAQRPNATQVAGFRAWQGMHRQVRRGEKAITILAPCTRREQDEDGGQLQRIVGFRGASVFDVGQTDGDELPEPPCHRLTGDAPREAWAKLEEFAVSLGYTVKWAELPTGRNGDCNAALRTIRVSSELTHMPAQSVKTLTHEIAHALLHGEALREGHLCDRPRAELEAESVAFVVLDASGIDSQEYTFGYVATWAGGTDQAIATVRESGQRISGAARKVIVALGNEPRVPTHRA